MKIRAIKVGDTFTAECFAGMTGYMILRGQFQVARITKAPIFYCDGIGQLDRLSRRDRSPRPEGPSKNTHKGVRFRLEPDNTLREVRKSGYGFSWSEVEP